MVMIGRNEIKKMSFMESAAAGLGDFCGSGLWLKSDGWARR